MPLMREKHAGKPYHTEETIRNMNIAPDYLPEEFLNPSLHAEEHKMLESFLGRPLSAQEAQDVLKDACLLASFNVWINSKEKK